jgi:hypothetical protein
MKKLRAGLRTLDNVAEFVLFDLLLRTRFRRRLAVAGAALLGLVTYIFWGVLWAPPCCPAPRSERPYVPGFCDPYPGHWAEDVAEAARQFIDDPARCPAPKEPVLRVLRERAQDLDRAGAMIRSTQPPAFSRVPEYRQVRYLGYLLVARGKIRIQQGSAMEGVQDLVAAHGLALLFAGGYDRHLPLLMEGIGAASIFKRANRTLVRGLDSGWITGPAQRLLAEYIANPGTAWPVVGTFLRGELEYHQEVLEEWVRTNRWPEWHWIEASLRVALPTGADERRHAADLIRAALESGVAAEIVRLQSLPLDRRLAGKDWHNVGFREILRLNSWSDLLLVPFRTDVGARVVSHSWAWILELEDTVALSRLADAEAADRELIGRLTPSH